MASRPREALAVYYRLLSDGFAPNSTTYNALISAYGKTAQLGKALEVYQEMLRQNMERRCEPYGPGLIGKAWRGGLPRRRSSRAVLWQSYPRELPVCSGPAA
jgi:pentatricopeptide repeat protein